MDSAEMGMIGGRSTSNTKTLASAKNGKLGGRPIKIPTLNSDGISISGCSYIYAPKGQAGEYAELASNPYRGCGHKCAYCYVPKVLRMKDRKEFDNSANLRPGFIDKLKKDAAKYQMLNMRGQVLLSFTTDVYHPYDNTPTSEVIDIITGSGLGICVLTKGGSRSLRDIDMFRQDRDAYAATLTSTDDAFSKKWEPGAAPATDRIHALKKFNDRGIYTWVSLEPTLDVDASLEVVRKTHQFVDLYKVGRVNYLPMTKTTDWDDYTHRMIDLLTSLGKQHYIKKDLQKYLPDNYYNPLRRPQIKT